MLRNRESLKIFEQASYMVKLIEEHYFSDYIRMEYEGLEADTSWETARTI